MHHIRHYILTTLSRTEWARFRDMRPPNVDSNAYSYHLKSLLKESLLEKADKQYRLSPQGLAVADRISRSQLTFRHQPRILTMTVIENDNGEVLMLHRNKQPFIGSLSIPNGTLHMEDVSIKDAARREIMERVHFEAYDSLNHKADAYIYAYINDYLVSAVLVHVFNMQLRGEVSDRDDILWANKAIREQHKLVPALEDIIGLAQSKESALQFREFIVDWE